jgi:uncharacterized protein (DUF2252 family)
VAEPRLSRRRQGPTPREVRIAAGFAQRSLVPLDAHGEVAASGRPDPVGILVAQDEARLPGLVPIRHGRMNVSPFTFYRGAAAVMASDLAAVPSSGIEVQLCGDAHLSNFGLFKGPDRRLVFDMNDFDETHPGPFEWDVKRLAASVAVAARGNGFTPKQVERATAAAASGYRDVIARASTHSPLELSYFRIEAEAVQAQARESQRRSLEKATKQASAKDSLRALSKLTEVVDGRRVIVADPPLIVRFGENLAEDEIARLRRFLRGYLATLPPHRRRLVERYRVVDAAHKVVGVGSVGTRCLIVLLQSDDDHPLFLQFKEATRSVLEPHTKPSQYKNAGQRVVNGQLMMQSASDVFLGWSRYRNDAGREIDFYFRQLWDGKGSAVVENMAPSGMRRYAAFCGGTLALAHARTGDAATIMGYIGGDPEDRAFDAAVTTFASAYADVNERDHAAHRAAIDEGRVEAAPGL